MSEITFPCPHCQQQLEAPPEYAGAEIECPSCNQALVVPAAEAKEPAASPAGCPGCGAEMAPDAIFCVACGYDKRSGKKVKTEL